MHFKRDKTIRDFLLSLKDKDIISRKVGSSIDTSVAGWTVKKNMMANLEEHLLKDSKNLSRPPHQSMTTTTSQVMSQLLTTSALCEREKNLARSIKEAILIRVNDPSLNRSNGKYHLPHILDEVVHNTPELKFK